MLTEREEGLRLLGYGHGLMQTFGMDRLRRIWEKSPHSQLRHEASDIIGDRIRARYDDNARNEA